MKIPKVSVIIPTYNRPELLKKAIQSVLSQTFQDFEIIIVDDGLEKRADDVIKKINDAKITYIQHKKSKGGSAARNTGIKNAEGKYVAFLDDDDQWLPKKLEIQMSKFENTQQDVGFCFSAVTNDFGGIQKKSDITPGINNLHELALKRFKGFLTVTLIIKRYVFEEVGFFDESLPSHQEIELMIRVTKKYKGLGINEPLVLVNMHPNHASIGKNIKKRIAGREMVLKKHSEEYKKYPKILSRHYFFLGLIYRDDKQYKEAKNAFKSAWETHFNLRYFIHYLYTLILF